MRKLRTTAALAVASLFGLVQLAAGCGSSVADDCAAWVRATCERDYACRPNLHAIGSYPDPDTCALRAGALCDTYAGLPGTNLGSGDLGACASDIADASCDDWTSYRFTSEACDRAQRGTRKDGKSCVQSIQCESGACAQPSGAPIFGCGTCARRRIKGQSCVDDGDFCDVGLACTSEGSCDDQADEGASCKRLVCKYGLHCEHDVCTAARTAGAKCNGDGYCDYAHGAFCDTDASVCADRNAPFLGAVCYERGSGGFYPCESGSFCDVQVSRKHQFHCAPTLPDGAPCEVVAQDPCSVPATCQDGSCQLPEAGKCN